MLGKACPVFVGDGSEGINLGLLFVGEGISRAETSQPGKGMTVDFFGGLYSNRWTFYIDATGTLREIDKDVSPATAGQDIVDRLERLGFPKRARVKRD